MGVKLATKWQALMAVKVFIMVLAANQPMGFAQGSFSPNSSGFPNTSSSLSYSGSTGAYTSPAASPSYNSSYIASSPVKPYQSYSGSSTVPYSNAGVSRTSYGPSTWSPAAKIITGTATGAVLGGLVGLFTGLSMHATSQRPVTRITNTTNTVTNNYYKHCGRVMTATATEVRVAEEAGKRMAMSRGSAAARGYAWGTVYGSAAGLLGGIAYAYFTRDPVAVSSSSY